MKFNDYFRLAKITLKERKKSTSHTVKGITFGLVLLIPLLFITMAFYVDLNKTVNKDPAIRNFNIGVINQKTESPLSESLYLPYVENVEKANGVEKVIKSRTYSFKNMIDTDEGVSSCLSFTLDGRVYDISTSTDLKVTYDDIGIEIFDNLDPSFVEQKDTLVDGKYFVTGKKEIMVSSSFLTKYSLKSEDVIGKKISIDTLLGNKEFVTTSRTEEKDELEVEEGTKVQVLKDYEIIGVFNSDVYKNSLRKESFSSLGEIDTYFWLNESSIGEYSLPEKTFIKRKLSASYYMNIPFYYYEQEPTFLSSKAIEKEEVFLPLGYGIDSDRNVDSRIIIENKDYKSADKLASSLDNYLKLSSSSSSAYTNGQYMNEAFSSYRSFYRIFLYVSIALALFGGVVFFTNLLNLYNTINYSVQSRTNYIGLSRAIGMKSKQVVTLYFVEILEIFKRSYLWSILIGGSLSFIIKFVFDYVMRSDITASLTIRFSLNPWFILLSIVILIINNTIISLVFALVSTHNVASKPILETLSNDK